jgi:hypothetical protein
MAPPRDFERRASASEDRRRKPPPYSPRPYEPERSSKATTKKRARNARELVEHAAAGLRGRRGVDGDADDVHADGVASDRSFPLADGRRLRRRRARAGLDRRAVRLGAGPTEDVRRRRGADELLVGRAEQPPAIVGHERLVEEVAVVEAAVVEDAVALLRLRHRDTTAYANFLQQTIGRFKKNGAGTV